MKISELPFNPDVSPAAMKAALDFFTGYKPFSEQGVANFRIIDQSGNYDDCVRAQCHGPISYNGLSDRCLVATDNGWSRNIVFKGKGEHPWNKKTDVQLMKKYFDWLTKESWASRFILNREDETFMWENGFIVSADMPTPLMQNILIMTRHFREMTPIAFEAFNDVYDKYGDGVLAYLFSFGTTLSVGGFDLSHPIGPYNSHRAWKLPASLATLKNHLQGEFGATLKDNKKIHYRVHNNYTGGAKYCVDSTCSDSGYYSLAKELFNTDKEYKDELLSGRGQSVEIPNPFARTTSQRYLPGTYVPVHESHPTRREIFDVLLPYLERKGIISVKDNTNSNSNGGVADGQMDRAEAA